MDHSKRHFTQMLLGGLVALPGVTLASAAGTKHTVEIVGAKFKPAAITLAAGDSVTWINRDIVPHTATALDNSWDSGLLNSGEQYTHQFEGSETPEYFCALHPGMRAKLVF